MTGAEWCLTNLARLVGAALQHRTEVTQGMVLPLGDYGSSPLSRAHMAGQCVPFQ